LSDRQTANIEVLRAWYTTVATMRKRAIKDADLAKMNEWVAQYVKIAKVALRGKKQLLEASADRRDGAHHQDGGTESRAAESGGNARREEGVMTKRPGRFPLMVRHGVMIAPFDHLAMLS
jgi:hypothetical protein